MKQSLSATSIIMVGVITIVACAGSTHSSPIPAPTPAPSTGVSPTAPPKPADEHHALYTGPWTFLYTPGTYTYTVTTAGRIMTLPDTTRRKLFPSTAEQITFRITTDSDPQIIPSSPTMMAPSSCDPAAVRSARARQFIPKLPTSLTTGLTWKDSTTTAGCWETVPTTMTRRSIYTVVGDTTFEGTMALHLKDVDTISTTGEGSIEQHRVLFAAMATGTRELYLDTRAGRLLGFTNAQIAELSITTSGRTQHLHQEVAEHVTRNTP